MPASSHLIVSLTAPASRADLSGVRDLPGVRHVHLDDYRTWLLVSFDPRLVTPDSIVTQLSVAGFVVASVSHD